MSKVSKAEIEKVFNLSRLPEQDFDKMGKDIGEVIEYFDMLSKIENIDDAEPLYTTARHQFVLKNTKKQEEELNSKDKKQILAKKVKVPGVLG